MTTPPSPLLKYIVIAALIGVLGSSVAIAAFVHFFADRMEVAIRATTTKLAVFCVVAHLVTMTLGGLALGSIGGIPSGPFFGPPLAILATIYAPPLVIGGAGVGTVVVRSSDEASKRRLGLLSGVTFAAGHLVAVPITWAIVITLEALF